MSHEIDKTYEPSETRKSAEINLHRLTVLYDGVEVLGATVVGKRPENSEELHTLLREIIAMHKAPEVPDPEVLGSYSPK
jgi:hypothetical protein